jgi:hypothetical protein
MPYVITRRNGKKVKSPWVLVERDVNNLAADRENCWTVANVVTRRTEKVGTCPPPRTLNGGRR